MAVDMGVEATLVVSVTVHVHRNAGAARAAGVVDRGGTLARKDVCGSCMQETDKHLHWCPEYRNGNRTGQMSHDRGPAHERSSSLDDARYQHKRDKDSGRFRGTVDKRLQKLQEKSLGKTFSWTAPTPDKIPIGMVAVKSRGGYTVEYDNNQRGAIKGTKRA
jgi:hypothetical protein